MNISGQDLILDKEFESTKAMVDTGADGLYLPGDAAEHIKLKLGKITPDTTLIVKLTLKSFEIMTAGKIVLNWKVSINELLYGLSPSKDSFAIIGYPMMSQSYMVFDADSQKVGACSLR